MNNLKLMKTENFETIPCDFWVDANGEYLVTREQIGKALGYSNPSKAIEKIHSRHKDRLDKYSCLIKTCISRSPQSDGTKSNGAIQERTFYSRKGIMEICRWSNKPLADKFMDWCWEVIDKLVFDNNQNSSMVSSNQMAAFIDSMNDISKQNSLLLKQNRELENKVERLKNMVSTLMPPTKHSMWKNQISEKIKAIGKQLGLEGQKEVRSIYGEIYNIMRNDYGLDVNNYKSDYLRNHTDVSNAPAIDIIDDYSELKELFETIVDNYLEIKTKNE